MFSETLQIFCVHRFCIKGSSNKWVLYSLANFSFQKQENISGKRRRWVLLVSYDSNVQLDIFALLCVHVQRFLACVSFRPYLSILLLLLLLSCCLTQMQQENQSSTFYVHQQGLYLLYVLLEVIFFCIVGSKAVTTFIHKSDQSVMAQKKRLAVSIASLSYPVLRLTQNQTLHNSRLPNIHSSIKVQHTIIILIYVLKYFMSYMKVFQ